MLRFPRYASYEYFGFWNSSFQLAVEEMVIANEACNTVSVQCDKYNLAGVDMHGIVFPFYQTGASFNTVILRVKIMENIVGKEESAGYQHFLLCPEYFVPY